MIKKKAVVVHSGGMDSSICLALAIHEWGLSNVLSLSFSYGQRHAPELIQAAKICCDWNVDHTVIPLDCLQQITDNALMNKSLPIEHQNGKTPNTLVVGRNGLMARLAAIHANHLTASCIYMGIIEVESSNSGYLDCSRSYMDLKQQILRIDLNDPFFEIRTPLVFLSKAETLKLADQLGILEYLWQETVTCYEGNRPGCGQCPACKLRNQGMDEYSFLKMYSEKCSRVI